MTARIEPIPPPFFSPYLDDQCNKINSKPVPWEGYQRAKLLSADELNLLKSLAKIPTAQRPTVYASSGAQYARLYIDLLRKLQRVDTVQAVLVSINDMLVSDPSSTIPLFHSLATKENPDDPYAPIVKCLAMEEEFVILTSLKILGVLIATDSREFPYNLTGTLLASLQGLLNGSRIPLWEVAAQVLSAVLGTKQFRLAVWEEEQCISGLVKMLKTTSNPQNQYWAVSCLWQLSFERIAAEGMNKRYDIVALLTGVAKAAVKEKVLRVIISTFRNLLTIAPSQSLPSFFTSKVLQFVITLQDRKWSDEDIPEDLSYLKSELSARLENLTTYDELISELDSGHLVWGPVHESEDFWKENAMRIGQESGGKAVKRLVELLKNSREPVVLAVAAHDLGFYIRYGGDKAKQIVTDLGGKTRVMELMTSQDPDTRYQALMCTQLLMSQHV
ncbi:armadillo-type protein [Kockovaella imperatae]|uniref:V-type proton ATPase subunit H n=1 Tax=Kockovaella imperatae TaxID=4999 RepID=A0A1Y1USP6_9TREE|nr:armadillo-type protein [Kockovaella imperatae]ORX40982.1 armadillo-type protein [Kockovaella imperatae]